MKEDLRQVLDKLMSEFVSASANANIACLKLQLTGHLSQDECDLIQSSKIATAKFLMMFTLLKPKSEKVLRRIQEICIESEWDELYKVIQSTLATCGNYDHLIITEEEMISYRVKYKMHSDSEKTKPVCFEIRDPTHDFVGRSPQLAELHKLMQRSEGKDESEVQKIVISEKSSTITGLGGIGKTQLALKYIQLFSKHYNSNVIWINAESESTIRDSFQRLAQSLKINTKNVHGKEKDTKYIANDVYAHFSKAKCLFVFDNAEKPIQDELYPGGPNKQIYILITSRFQDWGRINVLLLKNFTLEEATEFIKNALKINDADGKGKDVVQLAETLHLFPLAIKQATSYISETNVKMDNVGSSFTIADYINMYNEKKEDLLNYKFFTGFGNPHSQTTFTTWSITINKIAESKSEGKLALEILNTISYLADEKIEPKIFLQMGNKLEIGSAIEILKQYSMITLEKKMLRIHPLIQEITRLNLKQQNAEEETFAAICQLIESYFKHLTLEQDYGTVKPLMQHMETILSHIRIWLINNPSKREETKKNIKCLLKVMYDGYVDICEERQIKATIERLLDIEKASLSDEDTTTLVNLAISNGLITIFKDGTVTVLENLLSVQENINGLDHLLNVETMVQLGHFYVSSGDNEKARQMLERALIIQEKYHGSNHTDTELTHLSTVYGRFGDLKKQESLLEKDIAIALTRLGNVYGCFGDHEKQKCLLEKARVILEKLFGLQGAESALTLESLGKTYGNLGDFEKKKIFLERALKVQENHYGSSHFLLARPLTNLGNLCTNLGYDENERTLKERSQAVKQEGLASFIDDCFLKMFELTDLIGETNDVEKPELKLKWFMEKALVFQEKLFGLDGVALTMESLGKTYGNLDDPEKRKVFLERSLKLQGYDENGRRLKEQSQTVKQDGLTPSINEVISKYIEATDFAFYLINIEPELLKSGLLQSRLLKMFINDTNHADAPGTDLNNASRQSHSNEKEQQILVAIEKCINFPDFLVIFLRGICVVYRSGLFVQHAQSLDLILKVMTIHLKNAQIQSYSSVSLFYIMQNIKINFVLKKKVTSALLNAMAHHMKEEDLVRTCCFCFCHMELSLDSLDDYECAVQVWLQILNIFNDRMIQYNIIYLLNLLASLGDVHQKITMSNLGCFEVILEVINERINTSVCDDVLEISWNFLWTITDATSVNCKKFLNSHGMDLFQSCKDKFPDRNLLICNMTGLMGNIAEFKELRCHLMQSRFISVFCELLNRTTYGTEISSNSASVLAHMLSDGEKFWSINQPTREEASMCVIHAIHTWQLNAISRIYYCSLKPILRLLPLEDSYASTYWAIWTLANLSMIDGPRYCGLIIEEQGVPLLQDVLSNPKTNSLLRELAMKVLQNVQDNKGIIVL